MLLQRLRRAASAPPDEVFALTDAALAVYRQALGEHLPLTHIAEQSAQPQRWFARSLLQIVHVFGTRPDSSDPVRLSRAVVGESKLAPDMSVLHMPGEERPRFVDLRIKSQEVERYLDWARTVY